MQILLDAHPVVLRKKRMNRQFGKVLPNYSVAVLNEREIRAASGLLFVFALLSLLLIIFKGDFYLAKSFVIYFQMDFMIRLFWNPDYAPSLIVGRFVTRSQTPEFVGAPQKKFAWRIGLGLSSVMLFLMVFYNTYSFISGLICLICLLFLFFESSFGICLGCLFYPLFYKEPIELCPGDSCAVKTKQAISLTQWILLFVTIGFLIVVLIFGKELLTVRPDNLWEKLRSL